VRSKKRSASIGPSLLLELSGHAMMGVAVGLSFAFLVLHIPSLGIATLIGYSPDPAGTLLMFEGVCAIGFGVGATLTGLVAILTEDEK
jgi:hypothetical protein